MGGPHKHNPIPFRPGILPGDPEGDRDWLNAEAAATGRSVSAIISEAVAEYRAGVDFARSVGGRQVNHLDGDLRNNDPANPELRERSS